MATKKATGDKSPATVKDEQALANVSSTALALPDFIKSGDLRGTENITSDDIRPPALRIAQSMSPEVKRAQPQYIENLREGDFFNSLTREIYGEGPIQLVVINQLGHRHVEFAPLSEGGGVRDFNVPDGDPRTEFTTGEKDGRQVRIKPVATKFYDYLVLAIIGEGDEQRRLLMTMSLKSTQLKNAVKLNTLLKGSKVPSFAHLFNVRPVPETKGTYSYFGWRIDPAGWVTEGIYNEAAAYYDQLKGKKVGVETEGADDLPDEGGAAPVPF